MVSFLQVITDRGKSRNDLPASGLVVEMRYPRGKEALSLRASKMFHLLVKQAGARLAEDTTHTIRLAELHDLGHLRTDDIIEAVRELQRTLIEVTVELPCQAGSETRRRVMSAGILADVGRDLHRDGNLFFHFSNTMRSIMADTRQWAVLSRRVVLAFESRYALRLYEILSLRLGLEHKASETFELEDLRLRLGVPMDTLLEWADFRRFALEKAIAEINHISGISVRYEPIKRGRAVVAVKLAWSQKLASERRAAAKELERHRTGRKARRDGMVETVVEAKTIAADNRPTVSAFEPFPETGSIHYSEWGKLVRQHAPGHDVDIVANAFRAWWSQKPRKTSSQEKSFITFCKGFQA